MLRITTNPAIENEYLPGSVKIHWNPSAGLYIFSKGKIMGIHSPLMGLLHEIDHAWGDMLYGYGLDPEVKDPIYEFKEEKRVIVGSEKEAAQAFGFPIRKNYQGNQVKVTCSICTTIEKE